MTVRGSGGCPPYMGPLAQCLAERAHDQVDEAHKGRTEMPSWEAQPSPSLLKSGCGQPAKQPLPETAEFSLCSHLPVKAVATLSPVRRYC